MNLGIAGLTYVDTIGRGGFGSVHRAVDTAHGREVAVKVISALIDDSARRQFDRERRAMGRLSGHPAIGIVYTSGFTERGEPYIVMELLRGGSLADRIANGPLAVDEVLDIGIALADGLATAHEAGVLHLDVKPENILFSEFGTPKLVDFGIAALTDDEHATTTIRATPAYAAPEILEGRPATTATDVYTLGATLYAALTGRAPYPPPGSSLPVVQSIAIDPAPHVARSDSPGALSALIRQMIDKDPTARPLTMGDVARRLRSIRDHTTISTLERPPPPPIPPSAADVPAAPDEGSNSGGRRPLVLAGAAALAVGLAAWVLGPWPDDDDGDLATAVTTTPVTTTPVTTTPVSTTPTTPATTTPVTTAPATTTPATTTPTRAIAVADVQWTSAVDDGVAADDLVVIPDGFTRLCLVWTLSGVDVEEAVLVNWLRNDGSTAPETQATRRDDRAWSCLRNTEGLIAGAYEVQASIDATRFLEASIYVGGDRRRVVVELSNLTGTSLCEINLSPADVRFWGQNRIDGPLQPGSGLAVPLANGRYDVRALDCDGGEVFRERFVDVEDDLVTIAVSEPAA